MLGGVEGLRPELNKLDGTENKTPGAQAYKKVQRMNRSGSEDSFYKSDGFNFIKSINWEIKEFKRINEDSAFLSFVFDDFKFDTHLNHSSIAFLRKNTYNITNQPTFFKPSILGFLAKKESKLICSVFDVSINNVVSDVKIELEGLPNIKELYRRVYSISDSVYMVDFADYQLNYLTEGIYDGIVSELANINLGVLSFINKMLNLNFSRATATKLTTSLDLIKIYSVG